MVLTAYSVISPVIGLSCHRRLRINACLRPVGPTCHRRLDAGVEASGPHDFAVRISIVRLRALSSLTGNPPCHHVRAPTLPRPPHPTPTFATMANAPLCGTGLIRSIPVFTKRESEKFFEKGLDSQMTKLPVGQISRPVGLVPAGGQRSPSRVLRREMPRLAQVRHLTRACGR